MLKSKTKSQTFYYELWKKLPEHDIPEDASAAFDETVDQLLIETNDNEGRLVVLHRFGIGENTKLPMEKIGDTVGIGKTKTWEIYNQILEKLRRPYYAKRIQAMYDVDGAGGDEYCAED